jgi:hypothetical protein
MKMNQDHVITIHKEFPALAATDIARILGCDSGYVRATAKRKKLKLVKVNVRIDPETMELRGKQFNEANEKYNPEKYLSKEPGP